MSEFDITVSLTGDLEKDVFYFFDFYEMEEVKIHTISVSNKAKELAKLYNYNPEQAYIAGLLHDIGQVIPTDKRIGFCDKLDIPIIKEERIAPTVLHSKISRFFAQKLFLINDELILSAVECHSTLRKNSNTLDQLLFVADKLQWDEKDNALFVHSIQNGLLVSIERAAYAILDYFVGPNPAAYVMHPWAVEAYRELTSV